MVVGEIKGAGEETEVNIPEGLIRPGLELTPPPGRMADGSTEVEEDGLPETVEEGSITKLEETTLSEEAGDWVGRLAAGSVEVKKMVEMTVIVTGSPAAGSVTCGVSSEVEEGGFSPPWLWDLVGLGVSAGGPSTGGVEEGSTDGVEDGSTDKVEEDGSIEVAEGLGLALERVTLSPSNSASLRERSGCPPPVI
jgi:hypothetical protein